MLKATIYGAKLAESDVQGSSKCFCGVTVNNKYLMAHVMGLHDWAVPSKDAADNCFSFSSKCCYCHFEAKDESTRRYHLFSQHKTELNINLSTTNITEKNAQGKFKIISS